MKYDIFSTRAQLLSGAQCPSTDGVDQNRYYVPGINRVEDFVGHRNRKGGIDQDTLRQNISKINSALKDHIRDPVLLPLLAVTAIGKHGSKRYGVRVEKGKIQIE